MFVTPAAVGTNSSGQTGSTAALTTNKDNGAWTMPKGLVAADESLLAAAKREFMDERGYRPKGRQIQLGEAWQPGGKIVHVFAVQDDWNAERSKEQCLRDRDQDA